MRSCRHPSYRVGAVEFSIIRTEKVYGNSGVPVFGHLPPDLLLALGPAQISARQQVIDMGDKSPKSRDKNKKQGKKAKAQAAESAKKKQNSSTPASTGRK